MVGSEILDETDATGSTSNAAFSEYIYFDGKRAARRDYQSNVFFYFADQVGSGGWRTLPPLFAVAYLFRVPHSSVFEGCGF